MSTLQIRLLGQFQLVHDGDVLPAPSTARARALLAFLVLHPGRALPREALAGVLWPDRPRALALRQLQASARLLQKRLRAVPDDGLRVTATDLSFHPGANHWVDVAEFERCIRAADSRTGRNATPEQAALLRRAVDLYRADLLQGVEDEWCGEERTRLRLMCASALERLLRFHRERGELSTAIAVGLRLLSMSPSQERVHRDLMRCYLQMGDAAAAMRQLESCERRTGRELRGEPADEIRALAAPARLHPAKAAGVEAGRPSLRMTSGPVPPLFDEVESILADLARDRRPPPFSSHPRKPRSP